MVANNQVCGVGVAYEASIGAIRYFELFMYHVIQTIGVIKYQSETNKVYLLIVNHRLDQFSENLFIVKS